MLTLFGTIVRVGITEVGTMQTLSIFAASFYLFFLGQLAARLTLRAWQRVGILQIGGMSFWSVAHCLLFVGEFCTSIPPAINRNRVFPICDNVANYQLPPDIMLVGICNILMSTMIYRLPTALMLITAFLQCSLVACYVSLMGTLTDLAKNNAMSNMFLLLAVVIFSFLHTSQQKQYTNMQTKEIHRLIEKRTADRKLRFQIKNLLAEVMSKIMFFLEGRDKISIDDLYHAVGDLKRGIRFIKYSLNIAKIASGSQKQQNIHHPIHSPDLPNVIGVGCEENFGKSFDPGSTFETGQPLESSSGSMRKACSKNCPPLGQFKLSHHAPTKQVSIARISFKLAFFLRGSIYFFLCLRVHLWN